MSNWRDRAACRDLMMIDRAALEIFYPDTGSDKSERHALILHRRAKRVCARCPVRKECLKEALLYEAGKMSEETGKWERRLPHGVWGGHTAQERHADCRTAQGRHSCPPQVDKHVESLERRFIKKMALLQTARERGIA